MNFVVEGKPVGVPLARVDEAGRVVFLLLPISTPPLCEVDARVIIEATYREAVRARAEAFCRPPTWSERGELHRAAVDAVKFRLGLRAHGAA